MARRRSSARSMSTPAAGSSHMPLLLLVGAAVGGAYLYNKSKVVPLAQMAPAATSNATTAAAMQAFTQALSQTDPTVPDPTIASQFAQASLPAGTDTSGGANAGADGTLPPDAASDFTMSGLRGLRGFGGLQPSGALPGMGTYHAKMRSLSTGGRVRGPLAGLGSFHLSHVFNNVVAKPIAQLTGGNLKIPLAIATGGTSLVLNAAVQGVNKAYTTITSTASDIVAPVKNAIASIAGGKKAGAATGTTDCNGYTTGQVAYHDGTGATTDCTSFMNALNILQSQSTTALTIQPVGSNPSVFTLPSPLPVATILAQASSTAINPATGLPYTQSTVSVNPATGLPYTSTALQAATPGNGYPVGVYPSVGSTTQINPASGIAYPVGTPINPSTGAAYINPASGTAWPAGTVIDQVTGQPMGAMNPATGIAYPAVNVPNTSSGLTATAINPATGLPYSATATSTINPATGLPYPTVASPSDPTSTPSTTQINPATGVAYPAGTPINPSTGQAYINPLTGVVWPPYTVIDQYTGYPISAINPATGTYYPINQSLIASSGSSAALLAQQQAAYGAYGPQGYQGSGAGVDYTQDPGMSPNPSGIDPSTGMPYASGGGGVDPATGIPYSQEQSPAPAAPASATPPPAPASKVSWGLVAGAAVGVPAFMYFMHK